MKLLNFVKRNTDLMLMALMMLGLLIGNYREYGVMGALPMFVGEFTIMTFYILMYKAAKRKNKSKDENLN